MAFDITYGPAHSPSELWSWHWNYGVSSWGERGELRATSDSSVFGANHDGAGVGFLVNIVTERVLYVEFDLVSWAISQAFGIWGWANAEPMLDLWIVGVAPQTSNIAVRMQMGIEMRAVAPLFGAVDLRSHRAVWTNAAQCPIPRPAAPGPVFVGIGVKSYAGTGGIWCTAHADIRTTVRSLRV